MNIFYYSVHQILEYDEVGLFRSLGHNVFSLGMNKSCGEAQVFRADQPLNETESKLHKIYRDLGGKYKGRTLNEIMPQTFIDHFSAAVIMNDENFVVDMWDRISRQTVIWRTIGQSFDSADAKVAHLRSKNLRIVRYSPTELGFLGNIGTDAVIRFGKDPSYYGDWTGTSAQVLMFANDFVNRYPDEAQAYREISESLPFVLGGAHNEGFPSNIGLISADQQAQMYRESRVYLYATGLHIPYTLNFMEAWITGIPVVVYAPLDRRGSFFEVDQLVTDGLDGFVCRDVASTRARLCELLADADLAHSIGEAGRRRARALFDNATIGAQWTALFHRLGLR